jgi:hypothetical protein
MFRPIIAQVNTQTMHPTYVNFTREHCNDFPKTLNPGGIRTRVFLSQDGCDVHYATLPGRKNSIFHFVDSIFFSPCRVQDHSFREIAQQHTLENKDIHSIEQVDGFIYFYETMKKKKLLKMVFSPSDGQQ